MKAQKLLPLIVLITCLALQACNAPFAPQSVPEDELDFDISSTREPDFDDDDPDFAGLGFTWDEEMPGGLSFIGTIGTCHLPGPWDVLLSVTGNLGPENFLHLIGEDTVEIPQTGEEKFAGTFELPISGTLTDPNCYITYDLIMEMKIEITPYSLEIIQAKAGSMAIQTSCPGLGTAYEAPPLIFPTDFVVGPMVGTFECDE